MFNFKANILSEKPMSTKTLKLIAFIVLLVHGIGHLQGVVSSSGVKFRSSTSTVSWLLKGLGEKWNKLICLVLYLAAGVLGIFAALGIIGLLGPGAQWTSMAMACAIFSTLGLILFPKALALFFNKAGAIAVNLIIFYAILFNGFWPSSIFED
ncbi:MAG: hypothetical protein AMS26_12905 [Bacteroides sp. SM23_62]|nr:MAG: hypothetical protein AMS26_12905 [Bacteroides sp. SM23_62]